MGIRKVSPFLELIEDVASLDDLALAMRDLCHTLGFQHFALTHHVDLARTATPAIRLHNYPTQWAAFYDEHGLGVSDPVHRASHITSKGFLWSNMASMIPLTACDRKVLDLGRAQGIGDGFTVPANVPGEANGSCSFANAAGTPLPEEMLPAAQIAGTFAFESARRLWTVRKPQIEKARPLTDRQRDCLLWVARGKGDWETSIILNLSEETVARHIRQACERYGVHKRTSLVIRALFDGTLTFSDIFKR